MMVKPRSHPGTIRMDRLIRSEPLELEYLYAVLAGCERRIVDCSATDALPLRNILSFSPDIVLFTAYIIHCPTVIADARKIKKRLPGTRIFVGGPHAEVCPEHFDAPCVDAVFFADQLAALRAVVERIGQARPYDDVAGIALRKNGMFVKNHAAPFDPATLARPDRVLFAANPGQYAYFHYKKCASVKTSFGCPGRCTFCFCRVMNQGAYTARPVEAVVDEIASIGAESVFIVDDNFLVDPRRLERFADLLIAGNIRVNIIAYGTASFVARHEAVLAKLKRAGLTALIIGLEFADDDALRHVEKGSGIEENDAAIRILDSLSIDLFALFIVYPSWRPEDFRRLARYIGSRRIRFAAFSTATVFPGTGAATQRDASRNWWRYDLLRLHEKPRHLSPLGYYLRLYHLYLLPGMSADGLRWMVRRLGIAATIRMIWAAALCGAGFLFKLLVWR